MCASGAIILYRGLIWLFRRYDKGFDEHAEPNVPRLSVRVRWRSATYQFARSLISIPQLFDFEEDRVINLFIPVRCAKEKNGYVF